MEVLLEKFTCQRNSYISICTKLMSSCSNKRYTLMAKLPYLLTFDFGCDELWETFPESKINRCSKVSISSYCFFFATILLRKQYKRISYKHWIKLASSLHVVLAIRKSNKKKSLKHISSSGILAMTRNESSIRKYLKKVLCRPLILKLT